MNTQSWLITSCNKNNCNTRDDEEQQEEAERVAAAIALPFVDGDHLGAGALAQTGQARTLVVFVDESEVDLLLDGELPLGVLSHDVPLTFHDREALGIHRLLGGQFPVRAGIIDITEKRVRHQLAEITDDVHGDLIQDDDRAHEGCVGHHFRGARAF